MDSLKKFEKNIYSQNGEDGVIDEILRRLNTELTLDRWAVEFGAWDGVYLSNTCRLIRELGYNAVLIEGDEHRVSQLKMNFPQETVRKICRFVSFEGENTLDKILAQTPIPRDFDFLSIDIDGVDYYIFESLREYDPKIVCIEFNPSIPNAVDYVQEKNFSVKQGSSAKAIARLAKSKGYSLVHSTACNLIFIKETLRKFVISEEQSISNLNLNGNDPTYLFVGYDGSLLSNKSKLILPWHRVSVSIRDLQIIPFFLRRYSGDYRIHQRFAFRIWNALRKLVFLFRRS